MTAPPPSPGSTSWKTSRILLGVGKDLTQGWRGLALTDIGARILTVVLLTPMVALMVRWFLARAGSEGVVTDDSILFFILSPMGLIAVAVVGTVAGAIYFAQISAMLCIAVAAQSGLHPGPVGALRFVARRTHALMGLAVRALLRLSLVAVPVVAGVAGVYLLLLTRYDIYFYLTVKPPEYWIAVVTAGALAAVGAFFVIRWLLRWSFAIPILMFEAVGPTSALRESTSRTRGRMGSLVAWHATWLVASVGLSALATAAVGLSGRALIPMEGSMAVVAAGAGSVAVISFALNLIALVIANAYYAAMLARLYSAVRPESADAQPLRRLESYSASSPRLPRMSRRVALAIATIAIVAGTLAVAVIAVNRTRSDHVPQITAHRGAKYDAPENTLAAFELAIDQGADWVELDVQLTADSQVIVVHDRDFNRVAGTSIRAERSTLAELRTLDVGQWFAPEFRGQTAPTLDEVLELCRGRIGVNIELKYFGPDRGLAPRVIEIVEQHGMADQVLLMSFAHDRIAEAKALRPDWTMGLLVAVALGNVLRLEADFYAVPTSLATRGFIRAAHRLDREVHVWTVDEPLLISAMASRGADNLYTGHSVMARRTLAERVTMGTVERLLIDLAADLGIVRLPPLPPATEEEA